MYVINQSWDSSGKSSNLADSIGLMVYDGSTSLNYAKSYVSGPEQGVGNLYILSLRKFNFNLNSFT